MKTTIPPHEVVLLASVFVPDRNVHVAALLLIQVEIKLLSPLGAQRFGNCLTKQHNLMNVVVVNTYQLSMCDMYMSYTYNLIARLRID